MITKMKKVTLFMSEADIDADLTRLGQLGVVHIKPFKPAENESIHRVHARIMKMSKAIAILERYGTDTTDRHKEPEHHHGTFEEERAEIKLMKLVLQAEESRLRNIEIAGELSDAREWYQNWGSVSHDAIGKLKESSVFIKLYLLKDDALKSLGDRNDIVVAGKLDGMNQVMLIAGSDSERLDYEQVDIPGYPYDSLESKIKEVNEKIEEAERELRALHRHLHILQEALDERIRRYRVRNVQYTGVEVDDRFIYWMGYIPEHSVESFMNEAAKQSWGYLVEDPSQEELDEVPTLIRSPRWAENIRPVMKFMGLVPGYDEIDVSKVFMLFFTFFAGVLVGDAGYGIVFLLITLLVHRRQKYRAKTEFSLIYTLSVSVMFWGVLTGTWFGIEGVAEIPFLSWFIIEKMASFGGDEIFIQRFMFIIGALHLSVGHIQRGLKHINSVKAIAQAGWVAIVWGLYLIVNQMVLGKPAPDLMIWLFAGGAILVALFSNPGTNFVKGILLSLGSLPLSIISGFSDIISYIRLYAVGLATVLMAASFNNMAVGDGVTTIFAAVGAVIILLLGHGLNMLLAGMAVIVHGVRLNMLEYAGHAGVDFSGNEYEPFTLEERGNNL